MAAAPPFNARRFLAAIDGNKALQERLKQSQPRVMRQLHHFRTNMGDGCSYVSATLKILFANEIYDDAQAFVFALRQAGYDLKHPTVP